MIYKYYVVSVDTTPDLCHSDQLTFNLRYVSKKCKVFKRFVKFMKILGHGAEYLSTVILKTFADLGFAIDDCRGQTYDKASIMAEAYSGLQKTYSRK